MAPWWCRHDAADRVAKAASDGFALVEAWKNWESVASMRAKEFVGTAVHRDHEVRLTHH